MNPANEDFGAANSRKMPLHIVRDATDDPDVDTLALDLIKSQAEQQGMFLAWLRTSLALVVAGVAVDVLAESGDAAAGAYRPLAAALIVLGMAASATAVPDGSPDGGGPMTM